MTLQKLLPTLIAALTFLIATQTGSAAPEDFTVRGATKTNVFKLSDAHGKFVALHFLLKTECPVCLRYTRDYAKKSAGDTNVVHVFLKPDTDEEIASWATKIGTDAGPLVIYRDPNAALAKRFKVPGGYQFHGESVHFPALIILNREGKEVFRHVGKNNSDRFSYEKFTQKLKELTPPSPD